MDIYRLEDMHQKFLKTRSVNDKIKSGRPWLLSERGQRNLPILQGSIPPVTQFLLFWKVSFSIRMSKTLYNNIWDSQVYFEKKCEKIDANEATHETEAYVV